MTRPKRRLTSSKVPQKVALSAYTYSPSKSPSLDEAPQSPGSADSDREEESTPPGSPDQDGDSNESGTDQSHTTSSSGDFPRIPIHPRQRFTADETSALEQVYRRNKRPPNEIKQRLARRFSTSMSRIQIWFQNRRAKEKKSNIAPSDQRGASTATGGQDGNDSDDSTTPSNDPEQPEASTSASTSSPSSRRQRASRKSPTIPESSSSATKMRKKERMPVVSTTAPGTHSFLPSGSYTFTYPGFPTAPTQSMDPAHVPNTPMPNESFLFPSYPPQHPSHARGFFVPHILHPSLAPTFQKPHPTEKPLKYVDPKKMIKPDSNQPAMDHLNEQGTSSSIRTLSRKGKQKQKATEMMDSGSEQGDSEEQVEGDL